MRQKTFFALLSRRQWIKVFLFGAVSSTALGERRRPKRRAAARAAPAKAVVAPSQPFVAELTPSANASGIIPIRIGDFPDLDLPGGSMAIYFCNFRYPIVITRGENDEFYALDPTCTHQGCQVGNYSRWTSAMDCDCHGSRFDMQGRVINGPAVNDLTTYRTEYDGNGMLKIELTGVPLRIDNVTLQSRTASSTRLKLQFPGVSGCKYRVCYFADLADPSQSVLYSTTATGAANQQFFEVPYASDGLKTLWVDAAGAQGFFTIEMMLGPSVPL